MNSKNSYLRKGTSVLWFRHGLRLKDNPALLAAVKSCNEFYPVFIFDGEVAGTKTAAYPRMKFLVESLNDLDRQFRALGGRLYCFRGDPVKIFTNLFVEWNVSKLTFEVDPEPIWQERDDKVKGLCERHNVDWEEFHSHTLWNPNEIIENNGGHPPLTFDLFKQVSELVGSPARPEPDADFTHVNFGSKSDDDDNKFKIPSCEELGVYCEDEKQKKPYNNYIGGETRGRKLLDSRMKVESLAFESGYCMPNQYKPDLTGPPLSLSPHLRFGTVSVREFYWKILDAYAEVYPNQEAPVSVIAMLIWREYFYTMSVNNLHFNTMKDNPVCLNIKWYKNQEHLDRWTNGKTGFPWVDACMNQLRSEGWLHHVGRHMVSCFITRGDLWLSWEDGLKVFDKYLIDADWSVCAGNWMWVSSSAFEKMLQCPQCFSPSMYGRRMDPTGEYIRRYVPEIARFPLHFLFEPWKAPLKVQQKAGCIIDKDYPAPMVNHQEVSIRNQKLMEEAKTLSRDQASHCCPSNKKEVRDFVWLPDHTPAGGHCSGDGLCEGIECL
ncbi:hypothetical protein LOTGIDRAFT_143281 [Lottia gigantea]|uniref:Cryptochrome-1 n=1 Tax=Lottia gigantea TaxID=225164 RepID=V4A2E7_LOTGI|nr:hypothetical protein LOTGIDRAFT_143281 [Lottia gigantea]ESO98033.1 hypothetical protein LOTGIDRAFT_143281 [Lottia gigantea]